MRVLCIEAGTDITSGIEVDYKVKNPKIYKAFSFPTPLGMLGDTFIKQEEVFRKRLREQLSAYGIKTKKVIFVIKSEKIANREIEIPKIKDSRISGLLHTNSKEYFPIDITQYQLVYRKLSNGKKAEEDKNRVFVYAVPKELIDSYAELSHFCELDLIALDCVGNSVYQSMCRISKEKTSCSIKIDETQTVVTIVREGQLELQRTVFYGYGDAIGVLMEEEKISGTDGKEYWEYMCRNNCFDEEVKDVMEPLAFGIGRVLGYYQSQVPEADVQECILIGNGADIIGMREYLQDALHMFMTEYTSEQFPGLGNIETMEAASAAAVYGAALSPLKFTLGKEKDAGNEAHREWVSLCVSKVFFAGCLLAAVFLSVFGAIQYNAVISRGEELELQKKQLEYVKSIYEEYKTVIVRYQDVQLMNGNMQTMTDNMADAMEEMEQKLPTSVRVSGLTSDANALSMNVAVNSKEEAASVVRTLGEFEAFSSVETNSVTEVEDREGNVTVNFSVLCKYPEPVLETQGEESSALEENEQ